MSTSVGWDRCGCGNLQATFRDYLPVDAQLSLFSLLERTTWVCVRGTSRCGKLADKFRSGIVNVAREFAGAE